MGGWDVGSVAGLVVGDGAVNEETAVRGVGDVHIAVAGKSRPQALKAGLLLGKTGDLFGGLTEISTVGVPRPQGEVDRG